MATKLSRVLKAVQAEEDGAIITPANGTTSADIPAFMHTPVNTNPTKKQIKKVSLLAALSQIEGNEEQWLKV